MSELPYTLVPGLNLGISGKHALVVGGGRGLGRAIAVRFAESGAKVWVVARTDSQLEETLEEMGGGARGHRTFAVDLTASEGPQRLASELHLSSTSPDIVVHNLGGNLAVRNPLCTLDEWRSVQRLNLEVSVELNRLLIPDMQRRGWGRVVHVSSAAAHTPRGALPYGVMKAALSAYSIRLGHALASSGVVVTAIEPGAILSPGGDWERLQEEDPARVAAYLKDRVATGRFASIEEISAGVLFLCSQHASYMAGSVLSADGGAV